MDISFSPDEQWDDERQSIILAAMADGSPVQCVIPFEFLTTPEVRVPDGDHAIRLFTEKRPAIEKDLRTRIESAQSTSTGEIILKTIVETA